MYTEERQQAVADRVARDGRVEASRLVEDFAVTSETIRRDLVALERRGVLRRTHGGAISVHRLGFEPSPPIRAAVMVEEKARIARAALKELPEEGAVLIDAGTTTAKLAELLPEDRNLRVVAGSLPVINALINKPNLTVMVLGGRLRMASLSTVDAWTMDALAEIRVDVAFIGTNGITSDYGMTTSDQAEASVKRAMVACAHRVVLLADHTKVGTQYFHRFGDLSSVDVLISDSGLDPDLAEDLRAAGPTVVIT
jgi:DeoR family fructose operon transcriptional repressor